ncbi:MAG: sigma-70 family RNA polymerase sigma factor [Bacteroidota bacterium]
MENKKFADKTDRKELSQEVLWLKFIGGDNHAIDNIYRQNYQALFIYGQRFKIDTSTVEDTIQTLFINLFKYRKSLKEVKSVKAYIFRSFRNIILKQSSDLSIFSLIDNIDTEEKNDTHDHEVLVYEVKKVMNDLSPREREIILLKYFEDYKNDEIAEILGIENKTVRNLVTRALNRFRKTGKDKFIVISILILTSKFFGRSKV